MLGEAELPKTFETPKFAEAFDTRQDWRFPENKGSLISSLNKTNKEEVSNWFNVLSGGDINLIKSSFVTLKIPVSVRDQDGNTALHHVLMSISDPLNSERNCFNIVKFLINNNCPIDIPNNYGQIPLHLATIKQFSSIVELLLDHESCMNTKDSSGKTALHYAVEGVKKSYTRELNKKDDLDSALVIVKRLLKDSYKLFLNYIFLTNDNEFRETFEKELEDIWRTAATILS